MYTLVIIIHLIVSVILIGTVLLQVGKGASIGSTFGGTSSQALFGTSGPTTLLAKVTAGCAVIFMLTSLYLTYQSKTAKSSSIMSDVPAVTAPAPPAQTAPATPGAPAQNQ